MTIPFSSIIEGTRTRKDYGDLDGLKESLSTLGQIQSIVLSKNPDSTYTLIAGGRRYRAMKELGVQELHHGSEGILEPGRYSFVFRDEVPEDILREAELDENLHRLKPKWQEDVLLITEIHELKRQKFGTNKWGLRQTAELLGQGYGKTSVSYALRVGKLLKSKDPEILSCANMMEAISTLIKRAEDGALAEMNSRAQARLGSPTSTSSFLDTLNISLVKPAAPQATKEALPDAVAAALETPAEAAPVPGPLPVVEIPLSRMFMHGDSIADVLPSLPSSSFDHIVTDIPYGIDMENLLGVEDVAAEHDVEENLSLMLPFLTEAYRLLRSGGFCVFFYDLDHHTYLQQLAVGAGFKVQRWPYIACKTSACRNNAAQYNTTKNYEVAMFLRRDEKTVLRKAVPSSWKLYDFATERRLYNNPFAKPFELWKDIYEMIAFPGQSVLDPYAGEMSACRAAVNCGLVPFGVEKKEQHYLRGIEHMKSVYSLVHKSNVTFT